MPEYDVKYETTLDADSPINAAHAAVEQMDNQLRSTDYFAPILDVTDKETGKITRFDMETGDVLPISCKVKNGT